jgi:hypothetical protein
VTVAALAAGTYRELADRLHFAGYVFVGIIVVFLVLVFFSKKVIERVERKHLGDPALHDADLLDLGAPDDVKD